MAKASKTAKAGKAGKGGLRSPGKLTEAELKQVLKARRDGQSYREIAEQFRLGPSLDGDRATYGRIAVRMSLVRLEGARGEARGEASKLTRAVAKEQAKAAKAKAPAK